MDQPLRYQVLRNTETYEAWRRYSAKANRPLFLASAFPGIFTASMAPVVTALVRRHHTDMALAVAAAAVTLSLTWLIVAILQVRAYKRAHPFVLPPSRLPKHP